MDLRADVEAVVKAALHEFNKEKEREWIEKEKQLRLELTTTFERELAAVGDESRQWEAKYRALAAETENLRLVAAEEARLQTLKNLATTIHEIETKCEEKVLLLEEQLRCAEDALISRTLHVPVLAQPSSTFTSTLPVADAPLAEVSTSDIAQQRIAAVEAKFKTRKEEILRTLQAAAVEQ